MDYYTSAEGQTITKKRAYSELEKHGLSGSWQEFLSDMGDCETYDAQAVLGWIGY